MIFLSHPTGNANVRAIAKGLASKGILYQFNTTIAAFPGNIWFILGGFGPLAEFRKRNFDTILQPLTKSYPWYELGRSLANKLKIKSLVKHESGKFSIDQIYIRFDKQVARKLLNAKKNGVTAVYAYEDGALETFKAAKKLGLICIYDLPIAYWEIGRKLMLEEAIRLPNWAETLGGGIKDSPEKLERKREELELADIVVGPGSFVLNSLPEWAINKKTIQSPFGSPKFIEPNCTKESNSIEISKPLRILFVGSMGQRKGLGDLFEAMKIVNNPNIELIVLGSLLAPLDFYKSEFPNFKHEVGRAHSEVLTLMQNCDIFCLPSIVEGRALVMQEAMSQGLPIIITANTGGEDLVIEGETGFLIPIRSPKAIAEKINWFFENQSCISEMGEKAKIHAAKYTWENYAETIYNELTY